MSHIELSGDDFDVDRETNVLRLRKMGVWLVMFYMPSCRTCNEIKGNVAKIAQENSPAFRYARIDVSSPTNNKIISMAKPTRTPLQRVPTFMMFCEGSPINRYSNTYSDQKLTELIQRALEEIRKKSQEGSFMAGARQMGVRQSSQNDPQNVYGNVRGNIDLSTVPNIMTPYNRPWKQQ